MKLGKVIGSIWATQKAGSLAKYKLLTVAVDDGLENKVIVAADTLDAGVGETVILVNGSSARVGEEPNDVPLDAMIVAIVDESNKK